MEYASLHDLISCLEYKTNLHICIIFLNNFGNYKTALPTESTIHSKPFCEYMKLTDGIEKCLKCRNTALKKASIEKKAFGGLCFNGVYEYCHPIIENNKTAAVIFVGNILSPDSFIDKYKLSKFRNTFELNYREEECIKLCNIIEGHIRFLFKEYSHQKPEYNPLVENIRNYIDEFIYNDISVSRIASEFNYSDKYIGKLFKNQTGSTIREYLNERRLDRATELLKSTYMPITEISSAVGFNNVTYFNRVFKERFGICPTDYRTINNSHTYFNLKTE